MSSSQSNSEPTGVQSSSVGVSAKLPVEDISGEVTDDELPPPHADINRSAVKPKAMKYLAEARDLSVLRLFDRNFYQGLAEIGYIKGVEGLRRLYSAAFAVFLG